MSRQARLVYGVMKMEKKMGKKHPHKVKKTGVFCLFFCLFFKSDYTKRLANFGGETKVGAWVVGCANGDDIGADQDPKD